MTSAPFNTYIVIIIVMPANLAKGLGIPELRKTPSQFTVMKKPGNEHNLSGMRRAAVFNADPEVVTNAVTLILMESMRKY
jgi:hypothetical protein